VPAFRVRAVDSTGAGDAFDAGFLAGILREWRIERAILLGCAAGALSVAGFGGWGKIESFRRTLRFMRRGRPA
jgi:sugar/nucleoside kinase (ribokinase family)